MSSNATGTTAHPGQIDVLLLDYEMSREDERVTLNATAAMAGVAVALLAGMVAVLVGDCRFKPDECYRLPDPVLALTPVLPVAVISFITAIGSVATVRSFYLRSVEAELRKMASTRLHSINGNISSPSAIEITLAMTSPVRGRKAYTALLASLIAGCFVAFVGLTAVMIVQVSWPFKVAMTLVYGGLIGLILHEAHAANFGGRSLFKETLSNLPSAYPSLDTAPRRSGTALHDYALWRYLVLPRPQDVVKWVFVPASFGIGLLLPTSTFDPTTRSTALCLIVFVAFEYLNYQARYQWNDIRGVADDGEHPSRSERRRLPTRRWGVRGAVLASGAVLLVRVVGALVTALLLPPPYRPILLYAVVATWLLALAYEASRTSGGSSTAVRVRARATWLIVGGGYAIRTFVGLSLASRSTSFNPSVILMALAAWAFGIVFVTLTWVLEAVGHCYRSTDRATMIYADQDITVPRLADLTRKMHLVDLIRYTGMTVHPSHTGSAFVHRCDTERPLAGRAPFVSPWNLASFAACVMAVTACLAMVPHPWAPVDALAIAASGAGAVLLALCRSLPPGVLVVTITAAGVFLATAQAVPEVARAATAAFLLFGLTYTAFRNSSYAALRDFDKQLARLLRSTATLCRKVSAMFIRLAVGKRTYSRLRAGTPGRSRRP